MKVLVADPSDSVRGFLFRCLSADGHEVLTASNGTEAWGAVQAERPHVAVLDSFLVGIQASDLMDRIKRQFPHTRVIALVPDFLDRAVEAYRSGADNVVRKPLSIDELEAILDRESTAVGRDSVMTYADITVDVLARTATYNGKLVAIEDDLTFGILAHLVANNGKIVHRDDLVAAVWGAALPDPLELDRRIRRIISRLREAGALMPMIYFIPDMGGYVMSDRPPTGMLKVGKDKAGRKPHGKGKRS